MKLNEKWSWFAGFTAVFAALAAYVFWGTWSLDVVPVMPDTTTTYPADQVARSFRGLLESGRFIPFDLVNLVGSPYFWQELKYALALYLAALGVAYYCRGRGLSRLAGYGAGLLLGFCGYWMTLFSAGHYGWFLWMAHGVFAFGLADRAVRKGRLRHWLLLGAVVSWAGFNQQDLWLLFSVFTAFYFLWCCVRERKFPWKGMLVALAAFVAIGAVNFRSVLSGGTLKDRQDQIARGENVTQKDASEAEKRWEFVTNWSMPPEDTLEFLFPRVHGDTSCPFVLSINGRLGVRPYTGALGRPLNAKQGNYRQHSLYVGWALCLFALLGIVGRFFERGSDLQKEQGSGLQKERGSGLLTACQKSDVLFFAVAAVVFYLLSLGRYFEPTYRVVFALPFGDLIRCPVKWHHLTEFCLAVLAAYGIEGFLNSRPFAAEWAQRGRKGLWIVGVVIVLGAVNLACNDRLYCAPVSVKEARRTNSTMQMTILPRQQFQNPQVAAMVQAGRIVSIANYMGNPDYFLVGVLDRVKPRENGAISLWTVILGLLSIGTSLSVAIYSIIVAARPRNVV